MVDKNKKQYAFLLEQTSIVSHRDIEILEETKLPSGHSKIAFNARLQESNVKNANGRMYSTSICESIVEKLGQKAKSKNMLMEIDHPMFFPGSNDPTTMKRRASIVEIKNCGAVCRGLKYHNGQVIGEIETLSGFMLSPY